MQLKDLEYFIQIAEQKSFTSAANKCHISQPTISYAVKRLEQELGCILLNRDHSHKALTLTASGEVLYTHAKTITTEWTRLQNEIHQLKLRKIHLAMPYMIGTDYTPSLLNTLPLFDLQPSQVLVEEASSERALALLEANRISLGVVSSIVPIQSPNLIVTPVHTADFQILVSEYHPLAQRENVDFQELSDEKFILLSPASQHYKAFKVICDQTQTHPDVLYQHKNSTIVQQMIEQGMGIGLMAQLPKHDISHQHLVQIPLTNPTLPNFYVSIVQTQASRDNDALERLSGALKTIFQGELDNDYH